jgi:hypothetical protein
VINTAIADLYYKIEDKWFDLLDWLEEHHIPVYKIVDPLEKRGIPSLPVFVALMLIVVYFLATMLMGGISTGAGFKISVLDNHNNALGNAGIEVYQNDRLVVSGTTDSNGNYYASLAPGKYSAKIDNASCDKDFHDFNVVEGSTSAEVIITCGSTVSTASFCVSPADAGEVSVEMRNSAEVLQLNQKCGVGTCEVTLKPGMYYTFFTDTYSSKKYSYSDLKNMVADDCIVLTPGKEPEMGSFSVVVKDPAGAAVEAAEVHIVSLTDSSVDVVNPGFTNDQGKVSFDGELGKSFRILAIPPSGSTLHSNLTTESFTFSKIPDSKVVYLSNATSSIALTVLDANSNAPLPSVRVTIFDGDIALPSYYTNLQGRVSFGVDSGKTYRVAFFVKGYEYKEQMISAGNNITVRLNPKGQAQVGTVKTTVLRADNDVPIKGVTLTLFSTGGATPVETGYSCANCMGKPVTNDLGIGYFDYVMPGNYCVVASRGKPTSCDEGKVNVTAGGTSELTIKLNPADYKLAVKVLTFDGKPAYQANVTLMDRWHEKLDFKQTNENGIAIFNITEGKASILRVTFVDQNKETFVSEQIVDALTADREILIQLARLGTSIEFMGIFDQTGSQPVNTPLESGSQYNFRFNLGLPEINGARWDSIASMFEMEDQTYALLKDRIGQIIDLYGYLRTTITPDDTTPGSSKTITISNDYSPSGTTVTWDLPVVIQNGFEGTQNTRMKYKSTWTSGDFVKTDPNSGFKYAPFTVTKTTYIQNPDFTITLEIQNDTGTYPGSTPHPDSRFKAPIYTTVKLKVNITKTTAGNYWGEVNINQPTHMVNFMHPVSSIGNVWNNQSNIKVTINELQPIKQGDQLILETDAFLIHSGEVAIPIFMKTLDSPDAGFSFNVYGNVNGHIITEPTSLNEFTTSMTFNAADVLSDIPITFSEIESITMNGSSLGKRICDYHATNNDPGTNEIVPILGTDGTFSVDFVRDCKLIGPGTIGINITTKTWDYNVAPLVIDVAPCFEKNPAQANVETGVVTDISLKQETGCRNSNIQYEQGITIRKTCTLCSLYSDSSESASVNENDADATYDADFLNIPLYLKVTGGVPRTGININVTINFTAYSESATGKITKNKTKTIPIYVYNPSNMFYGQYFKPLPIQRYDKPLDCRTNYCTIDQLMMQLKSEIDCADYATYNNGAPKTIMFKLVDQGWTQVQAIAAKVYEDIYAPGEIVDQMPSSPGKFLVMQGIAFLGDNQVEITKTGNSDTDCRTQTVFTHLNDPRVSGVERIQLYMPASNLTMDPAQETVLKTAYSTNKAELLKAAIKQEWGLTDYSTTGDVSLFSHSMTAKINDQLVDPAAKIYLDSENKIHFEANSAQLLETLIKSFTAYVDPYDTNKGEIISVKDGALIFGGNVFPINFSEGSIATHNELLSLISDMIYSQLSIDKSVQIQTTDGLMDTSYLTIVTGNPATLSSDYTTVFSNVWFGGNDFKLPDKAIGWFDETGNYIFAPSENKITDILNSWLGYTTIPEKISNNLVVDYDTKTMDALGNWLIDTASQLANGDSYTTIVKTLASSDNCALRLYGAINWDGTIDILKPFDVGGIYMVTVTRDSRGLVTVYVKTLKSGTPPAGGGECLKMVAESAPEFYREATESGTGVSCGYIKGPDGCAAGWTDTSCPTVDKDIRQAKCDKGEYCKDDASIELPYCSLHFSADPPVCAIVCTGTSHCIALGAGCCKLKNPTNCYVCAQGYTKAGNEGCCPTASIYLPTLGVCAVKR